ncbi:hypothetical protein BDV38DRAFT_285012 [Aspergillus pseudotamarii]|uniref:Uncharacterized protein n=1 Tax=Aspergillus pseudotamarii TaxID=132259 RepID=A0A5N6SND1_ASPPS|nr:uncharacterized protein BDV38DRAFT_285012 [Aspergillus pseudotamarii]KAE8135379.1 hypothetical protein BDV38DRAFT_285012 [Aspergillus pseudotamarii]
MERLQKVQVYIHERCTKAKVQDMTIFSDPCLGGFTYHYLSLKEAENLQKLQQNIETASDITRAGKERELVHVNAQHKDLTEKLAATFCDQRRLPDGKHDIRDCKHCFYGRRHRRLEINVHEDFLPSEVNLAEKRAVIFELDVPKCFASYRDTTWRIVYSLCQQRFSSRSDKPELLLKEYSQLMLYNKSNADRKLSLASHTKSFQGTHYKSKRLPVQEKNVLLPLGLQFSYYDSERNVWLADFPKRLTCAHHFALRLPKSLPFAALYSAPDFAADAPGPSSYDAIASIAECPPRLSVHEYVAQQNVMGGRNRRWLSILSELGSSNINFSLQDTAILFRLLVLQAGRQLKNDSLRAAHCVFRDVNFCRRLIEQIEQQHAEIISPNWREYYYMETLLTLTVQLCEISCLELHRQAHDLLLKIRGITLAWATALRSEMRRAQETDTAESAATYCFFSALLCRRTFALQAYSGQELDAESLKEFIEVTFTMQESSVIDVSTFMTFTRNILVRDIKMAAALRPMLRQAVAVFQTSLVSAIDTCWPGAEHTSRQYTQWQFLSRPNEWWLMSVVQGTETTIPQVVHYHLTVWKQKTCRLSFNMSGMSYVLATAPEGHQIHLGYRREELVIRSVKSGKTLELVPRQVFGKGAEIDLPSQLVDNCFHWIDLNSGDIELWRQERLWKESNWSRSTRNPRAQRRNASLVDPYSTLFGLVAETFRNFEQPHMITVVQPLKGHLTVELKRMEAATVLESTDLERKHGIDASTLLRSLYVSTEFTRTVEAKEETKSIDNFLRPVNWVLWNSQTNVGLVIIPEEAEDLIPIIRTMQSSTVHLILYAAPFTKRMLHFDTLKYYALPSLPKGWSSPPWLPFELGILAGRLYFKFSDYKFLLQQLRVDPEKPIAHVELVAPSSAAASDNFFVRSQLNFLQDWLTLHRQGQEISHTPMGYVCQGTRLRRDHPFFLDSKAVEEIEGADRRLFNSTSCKASDEMEVYYDNDDDDDAAAAGVDIMEEVEDDVSDREVNMQEED